MKKEKILNTVVSLTVAAMSTIVTAMGITWVRGDCQDIFKFFGVILIVAGIYGLARNFINTNEQLYTKQ